MPTYDLFISYRRRDADRVLPLVDALLRHGLHVWLDQNDIGDFADITGEIRTGASWSSIPSVRALPRPDNDSEIAPSPGR